MNKLAEIRNQEMMCRERGAQYLDQTQSVLVVCKGRRVGQRALDEIAFHFGECNGAASREQLRQHPTKATRLSFRIEVPTTARRVTAARRP